MDIHPPHGPIRSWQEFLLHLLTITVGLFIALTLEASIEAIHHHNLVRHARADLRREIAANHDQYARNAAELQQNRAQLARDIVQLRTLRDSGAVAHAALAWNWTWNSYIEAAWSTARESGAVPFMEAEWISTYSYVYAQQQYINTTTLAILAEETKAGAALQVATDPTRLTPAEIENLLITSAEIDQSFANLQLTMKALDDMYIEALKKR